MANTSSFNLGADIVSMAVCTVLLYSIIQEKKQLSEHTRTFALLISATSSVLFTDACCWIVQGVPELRMWNITVNVFNYYFFYILLFFFCRYATIALELNGKFGSAVNIIMNLLLIPSFITCVINFFVPFYFSVDNNGFYHREKLFFISQFYITVGLIMIIIGFFISKINIKEKLIIASFITIPLLNQLITRYTFGLSTEFAAMLVSIVLVYGVVVARREQKLITTEKELYEAKIGVMVSQVQPHFMYNALSSIAMMCSIDPETAQEATVTFADYLRVNMDSLKQKGPVPFSRELEHLKKYLYIEKLRFRDKLNIVYDIQTEDFELPQLSVQPLVENAVKHGVGMKKNGGTVTIASKETDSAYEVIISDDGVGFDTNAERQDDGRSHVGMENTKKRLKDMCGADVIITSTIGKGTVARIVIPKEEK